MLRGLTLVLTCLCFLSPCAGQEVEGNGKNGSPVFSNADYVEVSAPLLDRIQANVYSFYLGNVGAAITLVEIPVSLQKHFSVTPSNLYITVPPSGPALVTGESQGASYKDNQFRLAATSATTFHHFTVSNRNMYVHRFTPTRQVNRYRNRIYLSHPFAFGSFNVTPFALDEVYHDFLPQRWLRRNWFAMGVDMPINAYFTFQPSFIRQDGLLQRSVNFLGIGLIIKLPTVFQGAK